MSQYPAQPTMGVRETNPLGIAGFVCAIVGLLFTGGILCPVGVILSLVALGKRPKGFAVAGLILGLIGSCGWILVFVVTGGAILAALGITAVAVMLTESDKVQITSDMANMALAIKQYEKKNDYLPAELSLLNLKTPILLDPWGNRYEYHLLDEAPGFDIVSAGEDGQFGNEDDVKLTTLGKTWKAGGFGVDVKEDEASGTVTISLGDRTLTAQGTEDGGTVTIDLGDRTIEIVGDAEGGRVDVGAGPGEHEEDAEHDAGAEHEGDAEHDTGGEHDEGGEHDTGGEHDEGGGDG